MEGPTLQDWGGRRAVMETLPAMESYEDMFKEITRKLYGEDNLADGDGDHGSLRGGDCDGDGPEGHGALAAFGLAALMQNGFPPPPGMFAHHHLGDGGRTRTGDDKWIVSEENLPWTSSKIASYNASQRLFRCTECDCVGFLSRLVEHWLGTHANLRVFQCPSCPYSSAWARCVRMHLQRQHNVADSPETIAGLWKENPVLDEVTKYLQRLKGRVESPPPAPSQKTEYTPPGHHQNVTPPNRQQAQATGAENTPNKRYCCTFCPYATDRRDLFTRHENIHRDEKPFQCYVCQKQFNRADHVKKHFLRMHRDHPYDLNRIRRPANKSGNGYYDKYSQHTPHRPQTLATQSHIHNGLNIPAGFAPPPSTRGLKQFGSPTSKVITGCNAKSHGSKTGKKKGEKRYSCCYCTWSGVDNWCLKRHLNTHLKPFVCALCDYKAARSERLATHVLKVHNKRACGRCSYMAEDSAQLAMHVQEHHPADSRSTNRAPPHVLRTANPPNGNANTNPHIPPTFYHDGATMGMRRPPHDDPSGLWTPHSQITPAYPLAEESWRSTKHFGAARLFHYMEASDTSEPENDPEEEPPPFICRECGCEFIDDTSLETHVFMHHRTAKLEDLRPPAKYDKYSTAPKSKEHSSKRCQKQGQHRKAQKETEGEIQVIRAHEGMRHLGRIYQRLRTKHISSLLIKRNLHCVYCPRSKGGISYHTAGSLAAHNYWRHQQRRFQCEHCSQRFRHRYQVILHSSRDHLPSQSKEVKNEQQALSPAPTLLDLQPFRSNVAFPSAKALFELQASRHYFAGMEEMMERQTEVCTTYKLLPLQGNNNTSFSEPTSVPLIVPVFPQSA